MAIVALYETSATVSTTELSLPNNATYSSGAAITTDGVYQVFIDLSAMLQGDQFDLKVYEKVQAGGTQRVVYAASFLGPQSPAHVVLPSLLLMHGWDVTLKKIAGTDRAIAWSIRQVI